MVVVHQRTRRVSSLIEIKMKKDPTSTKKVCPGCGVPVKDYEPDRRGTATDNSERRWHGDCWDKMCEELEKIRKEANKK